MTIEESALLRFWSFVDKTDTCWLWTGTTTKGKAKGGYGGFYYRGKNIRAHRMSLLIKGITVPLGYEVDHLCRVPSCVNPEHLEPVTHDENMRRKIVSPANQLFCRQGHDFNKENTCYERYGKTQRKCIPCRRRRQNQRYYRLKFAEKEVEV